MPPPWPHLAVCCVVVSSVLLTELFDVFIWNFSCTLADRFTLLGLGWLVPRFALVDCLEVIKSLYGRTAAWPRLGREDVRNAALQRPVAFAAVHVVERRWCHPTVDHVVRLCNGWDAIVVEITDHGELDLPVADVTCTSWERHCAEHMPMQVEQLASLSLARGGLPDVRLARAAWQAHCLRDDLAELLVTIAVLPRRDTA